MTDQQGDALYRHTLASDSSDTKLCRSSRGAHSLPISPAASTTLRKSRRTLRASALRTRGPQAAGQLVSFLIRDWVMIAPPRALKGCSDRRCAISLALAHTSAERSSLASSPINEICRAEPLKVEQLMTTGACALKCRLAWRGTASTNESPPLSRIST